MARNDEQSTPSTRLAAAANLLLAVGQMGPVATVCPGHTPKFADEVATAQRIALHRAKRALAEFLGDAEAQADLEEIMKAVREANEKRAAEAVAKAAAAPPKREAVGVLQPFHGVADAGHDMPQQARR